MSASEYESVFERTAAYLRALRSRGCGATLDEPTTFTSEEREQLQTAWEHDHIARRGHMPKQPLCDGRLFFNFDKNGEPFIWYDILVWWYPLLNIRCSCEHYHPNFNRNHFLDYTASNGGLSIDYIEAFFANDTLEVNHLEEDAKARKFGPQAACTIVTNSQRFICCRFSQLLFRVACHSLSWLITACDHRDADGQLRALQLVTLNCTSKFQIYVPYSEYRHLCPYIFQSTKTPTFIKEEVFDMLRSIAHDLADATPRRVLRHPTVQAVSDNYSLISPSHPVSLTNKDHVRTYINLVKTGCFPHGTDWEC